VGSPEGWSGALTRESGAVGLSIGSPAGAGRAEGVVGETGSAPFDGSGIAPPRPADRRQRSPGFPGHFRLESVGSDRLFVTATVVIAGTSMTILCHHQPSLTILRSIFPARQCKEKNRTTVAQVRHPAGVYFLVG
jgi:hypothetical protein